MRGRDCHCAKAQLRNAKPTAERDEGAINAPTQSISRTLTALNRKAEKEPEHRFGSLYRLIDKQMLYDSFHRLKRGASPGVDGVTVGEYEKNLSENLENLLDRLIGKRYRAEPVKRAYIAKANGKLRPLGMPALEDKIVQLSAARILESIYEADFSERSVAYRKGKPGARQRSYQLGRELNGGTYRWIVEADIASFFDDVDHDWLIRMVEERVDDRAFTGLLRKWLEAGVMEPGEENPWSPVRGTPQGGIISPVLANIYLHYVLDLWIEKKLSRGYRGEVIFMRYADDIIVGFEYKREAEDYLRQLPVRLAKFSLRLSEEKSSLVKFNRWESDDSGKFTFDSAALHPSGCLMAVCLPAVGSRLRLLLVADAEKSEPQDRETQNQQEEVPGQPEGDEGLDQESAELAAACDPEKSPQSTPELLELLLCDRELPPGVEILSRGDADRLQVVEPAESAQELHMGSVRRTVGKAVGNPAAANLREAGEAGNGGIGSCVKWRHGTKIEVDEEPVTCARN